jgi:membrane-associated protease RseP (regulator of RpoE activity)
MRLDDIHPVALPGGDSMMTLRNCRRWCVAGACWLVAWLAIGPSFLMADEYPVLAEWTQGKRTAEETPAHAFVDWEGLTLLVSGEADFEDGYWIGIYPRILNEDEGENRDERKPRGVVVNRVIPASPAAQAKLNEGDIIVGAGDYEINFLDELPEIVKNSAGEPIKLTVLRDGERMHMEVTPAKHFHRPGMLFFVGQGKEQERGEDGESREKLEAAQRELEFRAQTVRDPYERAEAPRLIMKPRNSAREGFTVLIEEDDSTNFMEGLVTAVQKGDLVEISLGSDDGMKEGGILHVYRRGGVYLGRVQVLATTPDRSAAKILRNARTGEIQKGDRVATSLKVSGNEGEGPKIIIGEEEEGAGLKVVMAEEEAERERGYWIGIFSLVIDQELAEKLNVEPGQGVLVNQVIPGSPAAKADLMNGDIILAAGDETLSETAQLAEIVKGSAGKSILLKVRRGEKYLNLEVTPAKQGERRKMRGEKGEAREQLEGMLRKLRERQQQDQTEGSRVGNPSRPGNIAPGQPGRLGIIQRPQLPMPGAAVARPWTPGAPMPSGLPDDMTVTIQKRGNKPAKVTVKQGEKMWQTTEGELGMLPSEAMGYVARLLGQPLVPGMGGVHSPGAAFSGAGQRFHVQVDEDGNARFVAPKGIKPQFAVPDGTPPRGEEGSNEGIRIKFREAEEGGETSPEQGNIKWFELRRPEKPRAAAGQNDRDIEIFELQELIQKLRLQLEERNEDRNEEKPRLQKKGRTKEKKVREKGEESE